MQGTVAQPSSGSGARLQSLELGVSRTQALSFEDTRWLNIASLIITLIDWIVLTVVLSVMAESYSAWSTPRSVTQD